MDLIELAVLCLGCFGLGIAAAGYFIGNGLRNFKNPTANDILQDDGEDELIKENNLPFILGVSRDDAKELIKEHPDVPHITINNNAYFPKRKLREWLAGIEGKGKNER